MTRYGVVLAKLELDSLAVDMFVESVAAEPLNWAAWMELARLVADKEMVNLDVFLRWGMFLYVVMDEHQRSLFQK